MVNAFYWLKNNNFVANKKTYTMKFRLQEIEQLSGRRCKIYSVLMEGDEKTLFERFLEENEDDFPEEIDAIFQHLRFIAREHGAKEQYFRPKKEGKLGDGVEALFDQPKANLRLYAIKYGNTLLVLGGGGYKSKKIRAFQEDIKLTKENFLMRKIAVILYKAIREKDLRWNKRGDNFEGQFYFDSEDY
jgi:hypothetical protein